MPSESETYLEAILELEDGGAPERVSAWLESHALTAMPLVAGMLTGGDASALRNAFGAAPGGAQPEGTLPVPEELRGDVAAVRIVPPRQLHDR
ncbi:MAG: hypothetical protein QOE31_1012 [Solirubrobacteraceae bacterium]|jgi:hypothetical protein|nr:hypothetical protein [Solirubrobacteraceae bacterium]